MSLRPGTGSLVGLVVSLLLLRDSVLHAQGKSNKAIKPVLAVAVGMPYIFQRKMYWKKVLVYFCAS